ncbi:MAG TPA: hypothetical protein VGE35_00270 [Candidatus Paceibacterota bacterium]
MSKKKKLKSLADRHDELIKHQMSAYETRRQEETARIMDETGLPCAEAHRRSERAVGGAAGNNNYIWPFMDD